MKHRFNPIAILLLVFFFSNCRTSEQSEIGYIERVDPALDNIISPTASIEIIAEGFEWSEGPVWIESEDMLIFSDVPKNTVYKWTEESGHELYLTPSGFTGTETKSKEPGSNGLLLDDEGNLILCQHGDRRIALMNASITEPKAEFISIADRFDGKRFNSPNDAAFHNYEFYFTDPPYGLPQKAEDPEKEIPFQGVYKVTADGAVILLVDSLTRPNGIAFTPDGEMIVANSDPEKARWYLFHVNDSSVSHGKIFFDATENAASEKGLPDGLKIDRQGNIFATGPGGVWIFDPQGKVIGRIRISEATSNCALSPDEKILYVTADMYVLRITLRE